MKWAISILLCGLWSLPSAGAQPTDAPLSSDVPTVAGDMGPAYGDLLGDRAAVRAPGGGYLYEPSCPATSPCDFSDYWNRTGGLTPRSWSCQTGYGPECFINTVRAEWLLFFSEGRNIPVLVHTVSNSGVTKNFGPDPIGENVRNGLRLTLGHQFGDGNTWMEGRFWGIEDGTDRFDRNGGNSTIIRQPFLNANTNLPNAYIINQPGIAVGAIDILAKNDLLNADLWLRRTWWDDGVLRFGGLAGYQFVRLDDSLNIRSVSSQGFGGTIHAFARQDLFRTRNEFHGGSLGLKSELRKGVWTLELLGKVGLGNMRETVIINGETINSPPAPGPITVPQHGTFAWPSNSGTFQRNQFVAVPELNVNGIYNLTPSWRLMGGYTLLYFSDVMMAGKQIDQVINPTQLPGPTVGALRPAFNFNPSRNFFVQGISMGAEYRW